MVSLIPETTLASLERQFGPRFRSLNELEVVALATADIEGEVSNARLQELQTEHPVEITRLCNVFALKKCLFQTTVVAGLVIGYRALHIWHLTPHIWHLTPTLNRRLPTFRILKS